MSIDGVFPMQQKQSFMASNLYGAMDFYNDKAYRDWQNMSQEERANYSTRLNRRAGENEIQTGETLETLKIKTNNNFDIFCVAQSNAIKNLKLAIRTNPEHVSTCLGRLVEIVKENPYNRNTRGEELTDEKACAKAIQFYNDSEPGTDFQTDLNNYVPGALSQGFWNGLRLNNGVKVNKYNLTNKLNGVKDGKIGKFDNAIGNAAGFSIGTTAAAVGSFSLLSGAFLTLKGVWDLKRGRGKTISELLTKNTKSAIKYLEKNGLNKTKFVKNGGFQGTEARTFLNGLKQETDISRQVEYLRKEGINIKDNGCFDPMNLGSLYEGYANGALAGLRTGLTFAPITAAYGAYEGYNNI